MFPCHGGIVGNNSELGELWKRRVAVLLLVMVLVLLFPVVLLLVPLLVLLALVLFVLLLGYRLCCCWFFRFRRLSTGRIHGRGCWVKGLAGAAIYVALC